MSTENTSKGSLLGSASLVSAGTAFSRILGLIREQVMAYYFGASMATDAFVAAYRIPNLLRDMFAEGALSSAFVPVFKGQLVQTEREEAFKIANTVIGALVLVVGLIVVLGIIAAPAVVYISAAGFADEVAKFDLTVGLTQVMFAYLLIVSLSALAMGMLNSFGRFGIPAVAPAMFNIGSILSTVALYHFLAVPIYSMAIGVLVGGIGQLVIQLPSLWRLGFRLRPRLDFLDEGFKKIVRLFLPMIVGMSAGRVNILLNMLLASFLVEGSLSYLNYSFRLMHFPLGLFAVALGTVALPKASELVSRGDMKGLTSTYLEAINLNMLLIVPSAWVLALWGDDIVRLVFQHGEFSTAATLNTHRALMHYSYGLVGFAAVRVTTPIYYALGDSRLPMRFSIISVVINMVLYWPLVHMWNFAGLAAATSVASLINWFMLIYFLPRKGVRLRFDRMALSFLRVTLAAFFAVYGAGLIPIDMTWNLDGFFGETANLVSRCVSAVILYLILCVVFRVRELGLIIRTIFKRQ